MSFLSFNAKFLNEDPLSCMQTFQMDCEVLKLLKNFLIDVMKSNKFDPYEIKNFRENLYTDTFSFNAKNKYEIAKEILLDNEKKIISNAFDLYVEYINDKTDTNLDNLNCFLEEYKKEIVKIYPNVNEFKEYEKENPYLQKDNLTLKKEKLKFELSYDLLKIMENTFFENSDCIKMKVVKKILNTEDFNKKVKVYFNKKIKEIPFIFNKNEIYDIESEFSYMLDFLKNNEILKISKFNELGIEYISQKKIKKLIKDKENEIKKINDILIPNKYFKEPDEEVEY